MKFYKRLYGSTTSQFGLPPRCLLRFSYRVVDANKAQVVTIKLNPYLIDGEDRAKLVVR